MNRFSMTMVAVATMAGIATAQPKQADSKAAAPAAATQAPEKGKPPAEIKAMLKQMGARQTCTGTGLGPDMKSEVAFKGTTTNKLALDGWFIQGTMTGTMGQGKTAMKMKMDSFMTYDAKSGKWRSVGAMNDGTTMVGTTEMRDNKITGTSTMSGPMGDALFRESGDVSNPKAMKFTGEMSPDKGKTWIKVYEMTCKK